MNWPHVDGRLAQVVKIVGDRVTLQVFEGTGRNCHQLGSCFLGEAPSTNVGEELSGRFFNAYSKPIDGGPEVQEIAVGGESFSQSL